MLVQLETLLTAEFLSAPLAVSFLLLETIAGRCTVKKILFRLRQQEFDLERSAMQMNLLEQC